MKLSDYTKSLLSDIEERIDPEVEEDYLLQWKKFWDGENSDAIFTPERKKTILPKIEIKGVHINDAIDDLELMLMSQLAGVSRALSTKTEALALRANYGTGIMTSLFGAELFMMPRETNTLPTTKSFNDTDKIRAVAEKGIPDIKSAIGRKVFDFGELYLEAIKDYPKISKYVFMYHPDTQGPLDIAELLWGSEMFYELYDDPDFVHEFMSLITESYKKFIDEWFSMYPPGELNAHWGLMMKGNVLIRDDSAVNLSPELYEEFALQYDAHLLDYYKGGAMHYCGKGDHFVEILAKEKSLTGINLSQPELNDMDKIYNAVSENGKRIIGLPTSACREYIKKENPVCGIIHGRI